MLYAFVFDNVPFHWMGQAYVDAGLGVRIERDPPIAHVLAEDLLTAQWKLGECFDEKFTGLPSAVHCLNAGEPPYDGPLAPEKPPRPTMAQPRKADLAERDKEFAEMSRQFRENQEDAKDAHRALREVAERCSIPWEQVKKYLDLKAE